jgi:hypothetical protein
MTHDPNEVVKVYSGTLVTVQAYKQALADAGIDSRMTGDALLANFGSAVPGAVDLYVHQSDFDKAVEAIKRYDENRDKNEGRAQQHGHPTDVKVATTQHRQKHHIPPHPTGQ